eukprot:3017731-Amphidinium_carterae.1
MQRTQLETALTYAHERARTLNVQSNERFARHVPREVLEGRDVLLRINPTAADMRMAAGMGVNTTPMQVSIDPTVHPPVAEVSAPAFSGPAHKLEVERPDESAPTASTASTPAATTPTVTKAVPKSPPPTILPSQSSQSSSIPDQPSFLMTMPEAEWLKTQVAMLRDGPKPWYLPHEYGASPDSTPSVPVLPTVPQDAFAQDVDVTQFATFTVWKEAMSSAPLQVANDSEVMLHYKPIPHAIIGFELPVSSMSDLVPPSNDHVYIPIPWNANCVKPPYEDFYLDGCRIAPSRAGLTGYEGLPLSYKGPMVEEEYWNRMLGLWRRKNEFRREQAKMIAQLKDVPLEFGNFGVMPYYKKVPETHRVRRFQLGKLKLMLKDLEEEKELVTETLREAEIASGQVTADALSQLGDDTENPKGSSIAVETATVADDLSPRRLDDVVDDHSPALETHAAQLAAALQAADGASAGSAEAPTSAATIAALHRRANEKISPVKPLSAPMAVVPEEQAQPSEAGSYRSVDETEKQDEQSEPPDE